ncbi:MAG: hypothetical protein U0U67_15005 [Chitinophagales bacterium]
MRNYLLLLIAFFTINATYSENGESAIEYNDKIVAEQNKIGNQILAFSEGPSSESLAGLQKQAKASLAALNEMKPFEKNSDLLNSAKALFQFYIGVTNNEYAKILTMINDTTLTQEELISKINVVIAAISEKEKVLDANFNAAQVAFANKYGFTLTKNELQEEIDSATKKEK